MTAPHQPRRRSRAHRQRRTPTPGTGARVVVSADQPPALHCGDVVLNVEALARALAPTGAPPQPHHRLLALRAIPALAHHAARLAEPTTIVITYSQRATATPTR